MCNKSAPPPDVQTKSMIKIKETIASLKPARKTRTKTRKPKFLSLNLQLSPENSQNSTQIMTHHHKQLNLFPLHPENLVQDNKDMHDENDVASYLLDSDSGATLNGLLDGCDSTTTAAAAGVSSEEDSLTYAYRGQDSDASSLVRTAMRNRERDLSDEKWVCYSEVLVEKKVEEEVSSLSSAVDVWCSKNRTAERGLLALKLDYQEILNVWSDKGPLYIDGESPQTVPDLHDAHDSADVLMDGDGNGNAGLWRVPELGGKESWKIGQREASVLRYKEKRQNRLFSKRIRYEVRKLNAEKRPRMKGRFVKISR